MSLSPTTDPQAIGIEDLQDFLVETAEDARTAIAAEDYGPLQNSRRQLREWAGALTGSRLALVEVALAFLDNLVGRELSEANQAARQFLNNWPKEATRFFDELVRGFAFEISITKQWPTGAQRHLDTLEKVGVILREDETYCLSPIVRGWLRELVEPFPFRMWRIVNNARVRAAAFPDRDDQAVTVAALTGVTETQARAHLSQIPLPSSPRTVHLTSRRYVRFKTMTRSTRPLAAGKNATMGVTTSGGPVRNDAQGLDEVVVEADAE
jgi:hypothetical protein